MFLGLFSLILGVLCILVRWYPSPAYHEPKRYLCSLPLIVIVLLLISLGFFPKYAGLLSFFIGVLVVIYAILEGLYWLIIITSKDPKDILLKVTYFNERFLEKSVYVAFKQGRNRSYLRKNYWPPNFQKPLDQLRYRILMLLLTTLPICWLGFSIISSSGETLSMWKIVNTNNQDTLSTFEVSDNRITLDCLSKHAYFTSVTLSTLGFGDWVPMQSNKKAGEILVVLMIAISVLVIILMVTVFISFIFSFKQTAYSYFFRIVDEIYL